MKRTHTILHRTLAALVAFALVLSFAPTGAFATASGIEGEEATQPQNQPPSENMLDDDRLDPEGLDSDAAEASSENTGSEDVGKNPSAEAGKSRVEKPEASSSHPSAESAPSPAPTALQAASILPQATKTVTINEADTVDDIQARIQGAIKAAGRGGTVTVTGSKTDVAAEQILSLTLTDVTVLWQATYRTASGKNPSHLILLEGQSSGSFIVDTMGEIRNHNGFSISVEDGEDPLALQIRGLVHSSKLGAILSYRAGCEITINGGTVESNVKGYDLSVIDAPYSTVNVVGGTVRSKGNARAIYGGVVNVSGGEVIGAGIEDADGVGAAVYSYEKVLVTGSGKVKSTLGPAISGLATTIIVRDGGEVSGGSPSVAFPLIDVRALSSAFIEDGGTVLATGAKTTAIETSGHKSSATVNGGTVSATERYGIKVSGESSKAETNGGTVESDTGSAIYIEDATGTVTVKDGMVKSSNTALFTVGNATVSGGTVQATGATGTAITSNASVFDSKTIRVEGGIVRGARHAINSGTMASNATNVVIDGASALVEATGSTGIAIQTTLTVTVNEGTVQNTASASPVINAYGRNGIAKINGGVVRTETGTAIAAGNRIAVNGGTVQTTSGNAALKGSNITINQTGEAATLVSGGSGSAIFATGAGSKVAIKGGTVMNESAVTPAVNFNVATKSVLSVSGGLVFSYGTGMSDITTLADFEPEADGVAVAWDTADGMGGPYIAKTTTDLYMAPSLSAYWSTGQNGSGIAYACNTNAGFLPLADVVVSNPAPTKDDFSYYISDSDYDGVAKSVPVDGVGGFNDITGGAITVYYEGTGTTDYPASTEAPTHAGAYSVSISTEGGTDYAAVTGLYLGSFTVAKLPLAITGIQAVNRVYDATASVELTGGSLEGAADIDRNDAARLSFNLGFGIMDNADIGDAKPVATGIILTGSAKDDYTFEQPNGLAADIAPKTLTITDVVAVNRAYDGTADVALSGGTLVGVEDADNADVGFTLSSGTIEDANAGVGKDVTLTAPISLTGNTAGNYSLTQPTGLAVDIAKATAPATIPQTFNVIESHARTYAFDLDTLLPSLAPPEQFGDIVYTVDGVAGDNADVFSVDPTDASINGSTILLEVEHAAAGKSAMVTIKAESDNYEDFTAVLTVTVVAKTPLTPSFSIESGIYSGESFAIADLAFAKADGSIVFLADDDYAIAYEGVGSTAYGPSVTAPKDVGDYTVTVTVKASNLEYTGTASKAFTIAKRPLTLRANRVDIETGSVIPELTYTAENLASGETAADALSEEPALTHDAPDTKTPGMYTIAITGGTATANYAIAAHEEGCLTISGYRFIDGEGNLLTALSPYTDASADYIVRVNADYRTFFNGTDVIGEVLMDGTLLAAGTHYSHAKGSTVITLKSSYLQGLPNGEHTLTVRLVDGAVSLPFTMAVAPGPNPDPTPGPGPTPGPNPDPTPGPGPNPTPNPGIDQHSSSSQAQPDGTQARSASTAPRTGDAGAMGAWLLVAVLSGGALIVSALAWRRRQRKA